MLWWALQDKLVGKFNYVCGYVHECSCPWRSDESIGSLGVRVTGSYKPVNMGAKNWTMVLWKNSKHTKFLSYYFSTPSTNI